MEGDFWLADQIKEAQESVKKWSLWMQKLVKLEDYTQENPMTELDFKNVQTRDGREVVIYTTKGRSETHPIIGEWDGGAGWTEGSWTKDGFYHSEDNSSTLDLVPAPKRIQGWANVYDADELYLWPSKEDADKGAMHGRLACIYIDVAEGEGL